jgi:hypothetical protein
LANPHEIFHSAYVLQDEVSYQKLQECLNRAAVAKLDAGLNVDEEKQMQ